MTAYYMVNFGDAQVYFDTAGVRCASPSVIQDTETKITYFIRTGEKGCLMAHNWDVGLAEFTIAQRLRGRLYVRTEAE
jgi:hypothetical protein